MYYWSLLNKADNELAKQVFQIQKQFPRKDDWILDVYENLEFCEISLSEDEIKRLSKARFKKLVKKQIKIKAEEYLRNLQEDHSKTKNLSNYRFQSYLSDEKLSIDNKKLLFQLRTRSTHTRANYKDKYKFDLSCPLCKDKTSEQTDAHLLTCSAMDNVLASKTELQHMKHEHIFDELDKQVRITEVYKDIFKLINSSFSL